MPVAALGHWYLPRMRPYGGACVTVLAGLAMCLSLELARSAG
jgi:hypothetical protein